MNQIKKIVFALLLTGVFFSGSARKLMILSAQASGTGGSDHAKGSSGATCG